MSALIFLNTLVNTIITDYFDNSRCIFIFSNNSANFEYQGNLTVILINIANSTIRDDVVFKHYGCQEFIIQHSNPARVLVEIERKIMLHGDRFNSRKYLIIPENNNWLSLNDVFNLPELQYIVNFLVIIPVEEQVAEVRCETNFKMFCNRAESYRLITHKYVGKDDNDAPEFVDMWFSQNCSFLMKNHLYPDKIVNQKGRILRGATFNYKPYSIIEKSPEMARGSENNVAHEYAKRHNMTLKYIVDEFEWGAILDNWTGNGILGNLATDKADLGYGALYTWEHEYAFLDFSLPLVRTGITCLVPAPRLAAGWLTPFFPFSLDMWIVTVFSLITADLVIISVTSFLVNYKLCDELVNPKKINHEKLLEGAFLRLIRIFLNQSIPTTHQPVDKALKYLFVIFLFGLLLTTSYSSGLASIMTIPRYGNAIQSVIDLANSGLAWGATQEAWLYSIVDDSRPQYKTLVKQFIATTPENLKEYSNTNNFAFSIERLPSNHYAVGHYITQDVVQHLRLMDEDLYSEYCIFMLHKNSPLLDSLNAIILQLFESGIIYFWEMKAAEIHMDLRVQNIIHYYSTMSQEKQEDIVELKWIHVEGAFGLLAGGYILSGLCFLFENFAYKYKYRNVRNFVRDFANKHKFWEIHKLHLIVYRHCILKTLTSML